MTSDARERLRLALDAWRNADSGSNRERHAVVEMAKEAEALLSETPAGAHGDHEALLELLHWCHGISLEAGPSPTWSIVVDKINELRARPRAVADAGALLRELRERILCSARIKLDRAESGIVGGVDRAIAMVENRWAAEIDAMLARATQPQPAPEEPCRYRWEGCDESRYFECTKPKGHRGHHEDQRCDESSRVVPAPEEPMNDIADGIENFKSEPVPSAGSAQQPYDKEALADRLARMASDMTYNESKEEGAAKHYLYELSHRVRRGEWRSAQQPQASEAAKEWLKVTTEVVERFREAVQRQALCMSSDKAREVVDDRKKWLDERLLEAVAHWDAGIDSKHDALVDAEDEVRHWRESHDALRKENEELRSIADGLRGNWTAVMKELGLPWDTMTTSACLTAENLVAERDAAREEVQALLAEVAKFKNVIEVVKAALLYGSDGRL